MGRDSATASSAAASDEGGVVPLAGRVGAAWVSIGVSVGSLVSPGTVITTLDDTSLIKLDFTVAETYLYALEKNLPVTAGTAGLPGREFKGKVSQIDSRVDPVSRSIAVRAELPNPKGELRPGMFMTVKLQGEVSPALLVPENAIVPEQGRTFVFVVANGEASRREVKLGKRRPGVVEIVSGLQEHERVVVEGNRIEGRYRRASGPPASKRSPGPRAS